MSTVKMLHAGKYWQEYGGVQMDAGWVPGFGGDLTASTSDRFETTKAGRVLFPAAGNLISRWNLIGENLTYGADPLAGPVGGTITGFIFNMGLNPVPDPPQGVDLVPYLGGYANMWVTLDAPVAVPTDIRDMDTFFAIMIGGDDTFEISSNMWETFAGDGYAVRAGAIVQGGDDSMEFSYPNPNPEALGIFLDPTAKKYAGDFLIVEASAELTGGGDVLTWTSTGIASIAAGDGYKVDGELIGGHDTLDGSLVTKEALAGFKHNGTAGVAQVKGMALSGDADNTTGVVVGGKDLIIGSGLTDLLVGDVRDLTGSTGALIGGDDEIYGGGGNDFLFGDYSRSVPAGFQVAGGNDKLYGGDGNDDLWGNEGDDIADGGSGNDWVDGDTGNDVLRGGTGTDVVAGREGNDTIVIEDGDLGPGQEAYHGGAGFDTLRFDALSGLGGFFDLRGHILSSFEAIWLVTAGEFGANDVLLSASQIPSGFSANGDLTGSADFTITDIVEITMDSVLALDLRLVQRFDFDEPDDRVVFHGDGDDEQITGTGGADTILGRGGKDLLNGHLGDDFIDGGIGDDNLAGGTGNDTVLGGADSDVLQGMHGDDVLRGGDGLDVLLGHTGGDRMEGGDGNDEAFGHQGADTLIGGAGDDSLNGMEDGDIFVGGEGDDSLQGGDGSDTADYSDAAQAVKIALGVLGNGVHAIAGLGTDTFDSIENVKGGSGADKLTGNDGANVLSGNGGKDGLAGGAGNDLLDGGGGNDRLHGGAGDDSLDGGKGRDTASYSGVASGVTIALGAGGGGVYDLGGAGIDTLSGIENLEGGSGNDLLTGGAGRNVLIGNDGDDRLNGGNGQDAMAGGKGNDVYFVNQLVESISEAINRGFDTVKASASHVLSSKAEIEVLRALGGDAIGLTGNGFSQSIAGNGGNNIIDGGGGLDVLTGKGGADTFLFSAPASGEAASITDFVLGEDSIGLLASAFAGLGGLGLLGESHFVANAVGEAETAEHRIVYNLTSGLLSYDADGAGGEAAVAFASLAGAPVLLAGDFEVT